jgi:hypothetical protein
MLEFWRMLEILIFAPKSCFGILLLKICQKIIVFFGVFFGFFWRSKPAFPYGVSDFGAGSSPPWKQSASPVRIVVGP